MYCESSSTDLGRGHLYSTKRDSHCQLVSRSRRDSFYYYQHAGVRQLCGWHHWTVIPDMFGFLPMASSLLQQAVVDDLHEIRRKRIAQGTTGIASRVGVSPSHGYETATAVASTSPLQAAWRTLARTSADRHTECSAGRYQTRAHHNSTFEPWPPPAWGCWRRSRSAPVPLF